MTVRAISLKEEGWEMEDQDLIIEALNTDAKDYGFTILEVLLGPDGPVALIEADDEVLDQYVGVIVYGAP